MGNAVFMDHLSPPFKIIVEWHFKYFNIINQYKLLLTDCYDEYVILSFPYGALLSCIIIIWQLIVCNNVFNKCKI